MAAGLALFAVVFVVWLERERATPGLTFMEEELSDGTILLDGVIWTLKDNGQGINWNDAAVYCRNLALGGSSDWELPSINQLDALYDPEVNYVPRDGIRDFRVRIKSPVRLTGYGVWSSEREGPDSAWYFHFNDGSRYLHSIVLSHYRRALCVRVP
jgi:hypothetical protein